ncbi:MAG: hypothetical protein M1817_006510 [Caeruleum heppii]|nr:MAG: hypothetical protein M1817_006510 [Caeruleum heppii]
MTVLSTTSSVLYYVFYPVTTLLAWALIGLAPVLHLLHYAVHACLLPLRVLARFETLYIYLGVAVLIGLLTGSVLHFSTSLLISISDLRSTPLEELDRRNPVVFSRTKKTKEKKQAQANDVQRLVTGAHPTIDGNLRREYADWLDKDRGKRREGLLSQTILEEEDDSDDDF